MALRLNNTYLARLLMIDSEDYQLKCIKKPTRNDLRAYRHRVENRWADARLDNLKSFYNIKSYAIELENCNRINDFLWLMNPGIMISRAEIEIGCCKYGIDFEDFKLWVVNDTSSIIPSLEDNYFDNVLSEEHNEESDMELYDWINEYN